MGISVNAAFVSTSMKIWTGRATLPSDTQTSVDGVIIPDEIKRDGSIAIYDPGLLRRFSGLKSRLVRLMQTYTLKFMGGYAVDVGKLEELNGKLEELRTRFETAVQEFAIAYPTEAKAWADAHPTCAALIASKQPSPDKIAGRFRFRWSQYKLDPIGGEAVEELNTLCDEAIGSLAEEIGHVYQRTFINSKSLNFTQPLASLARRCEVLAFTTPYVGTVGEVLWTLMQNPKRPVCAAVLNILSDPTQLQAFCDAVKDAGACDSFGLVGIANSMGPAVEVSVSQSEKPVTQEGVSEREPVAPVSVDDMCAFLDSGGLY